MEYFKNNIPQCQIAKAHYLQCRTSSKDSENLEKSLCIRDNARRPLLDARDLQPSDDTVSLIQHYSVIDITKWAQEYFQKPLSVNTILRASCRCQDLRNAVERYVKDDHKLFSRWKPISGKNGTKFQQQNSINSKPRCPDVFKLF